MRESGVNELPWSMGIVSAPRVRDHGLAVAVTPLRLGNLPTTASGTFTGTFTGTNSASVSLDSLLVLMRTGKAYTNIHTATNPGGEIRGQITTP